MSGHDARPGRKRCGDTNASETTNLIVQTTDTFAHVQMMTQCAAMWPTHETQPSRILPSPSYGRSNAGASGIRGFEKVVQTLRNPGVIFRMSLTTPPGHDSGRDMHVQHSCEPFCSLRVTASGARVPAIAYTGGNRSLQLERC
jgi:hypothetical protein